MPRGTVTVHSPPAYTGTFVTAVHTTGGVRLGVLYNEAPATLVPFNHCSIAVPGEEGASVKLAGERRKMFELFTPDAVATLVKAAVVR